MMEFYRQFILVCAHSFLEMLDPQPNMLADSVESFVEEAGKRIASALQKNQSPKPHPNGFTPLMMYAAFEINDERVDQEILMGSERVLSAYTIMLPPSTDFSVPYQLNALACAVFSKNLFMIEKLLETGYFVKESDYHLALELIALTNYKEALPLFKHAGCQLHPLNVGTRMTPMMIACELGHTDIVDFLVSDTREHESFQLRNIHDLSALDLAIQQNHPDIIEILKTCPQFQTESLLMAMKANDLSQCSQILNDSSMRHHLLLLRSNGCFASMLTLAEKLKNPSMAALFSKYLRDRSVSEQLNTLLYTLIELSSKEFESRMTFYMTWLKELMSQSREMTSIILPGYFESPSEEVIALIEKLLKTAPITSIEFGSYSIHYDETTDRLVLINVNLDLFPKFVSALKHNTHLLKCQVYVPEEFNSLKERLNLQCQRNGEIGRVSRHYSMFKENDHPTMDHTKAEEIHCHL